MESEGTLALMYHAIAARDGALAHADAHYALGVAQFAVHLESILAARRVGVSARDVLEGRAPRGAVAITFDDGHVSNHDLAWEELLARGMRADFFVNPARVGTTGYCNWAQLRAMAESGQSIQSHGMTHRYFTALDGAALRAELVDSRAMIEDRIGQAVCLLAPPGGRVPRGLWRLAQECGYRAVLGSAPGRWPRGDTSRILPRVAITRGTTAEHLRGWLEGGDAALRPLRWRYVLLDTAKRVLGDARYERVRASLLARRAAGAT